MCDSGDVEAWLIEIEVVEEVDWTRTDGYRTRSWSFVHGAVQCSAVQCGVGFRDGFRVDEPGPGVPVKAGQASTSGQDGGKVAMMTDPGSRIQNPTEKERESRSVRSVIQLFDCGRRLKSEERDEGR